MVNLSDLVVDGVARIGLSLYPVDVTVGSNGITAVRLLLIADPAGGWVFGSWYANPQGGDPLTQILGRVAEIVQYTPRRIHLVLDTGDVVVAQPSRSCACGSHLRMYNPFGSAVPLTSVPGPETVK